MNKFPWYLTKHKQHLVKVYLSKIDLLFQRSPNKKMPCATNIFLQTSKPLSIDLYIEYPTQTLVYYLQSNTIDSAVMA